MMMNLAHQMKHMPSLPTLASALCHIATIVVVMRGRTDLPTAPEKAGGGLAPPPRICRITT